MGNLKDAADSIEGIAKAVPIYQDLLQPAILELGKGVHTLSKTVHIALAPISALVWGYDQIKGFIQQSLEEKLKNIPKEDIISPAPEIAVPAIEALRYTAHREELREMFSSLLATSMNAKKAKLAHPSFVEIIKQISSDEAKILVYLHDNQVKPIIHLNMYTDSNLNYAPMLKNFTVIPFQVNCDNPELGTSYIENIHRLGLIHIYEDKSLAEGKLYNELSGHPYILEFIKSIEGLGKKPYIKYTSFNRTSFGEKFYNACIRKTTPQ